MISMSHKGNKTPSSGNPAGGNTPVNLTRKEFIEDLPGRMKNTVRGVDLALINEAITAILEGNATINGIAPTTRHERFIVIASYFKTARTSLNMFFNDVLNAEHDYVVAFNYKDKPYTIKFPEAIIEN